MATVEQKEEINNKVFGTLKSINDALSALKFLVANEKNEAYAMNMRCIIGKLERAAGGVLALKEYLVEIDDGRRE